MTHYPDYGKIAETLLAKQARINELEAEIKRLREAFDRYATHFSICKQENGQPCICGFEQALNPLPEPLIDEAIESAKLAQEDK